MVGGERAHARQGWVPERENGVSSARGDAPDARGDDRRRRRRREKG